MGMPELMERDATLLTPSRERGLRILAKSIYKELRQNGYAPKEIVALSTELISLVTEEMRPEASPEPAAATEPVSHLSAAE